MNYKQNSNGLPFTISSDRVISQQNDLKNSWQTVFLDYCIVVSQLS